LQTQVTNHHKKGTQLTTNGDLGNDP